MVFIYECPLLGHGAFGLHFELGLAVRGPAPLLGA